MSDFGKKKKKKSKKKKDDLSALEDALSSVNVSKKGSKKKSKDIDFAKGGGKKGPGKSTALTGKKVKSKKQQEAYERFKSGEGLDEDELVLKTAVLPI